MHCIAFFIYCKGDEQSKQQLLVLVLMLAVNVTDHDVFRLMRLDISECVLSERINGYNKERLSNKIIQFPEFFHGTNSDMLCMLSFHH